MRLTLDTYAGLHSPLHHWQSRAKLVGLGLLMLGFATVQRVQLVPACLLVTAVLYGISGLPWSFLRSRLRYPGLFLLGMVIALPLLSGSTVLAQWGPLAIRQEGLLATGLIAGRFFSIVTVGMVLLGTTPLLTLVETLVSLGLPPILAEMALLAYRYLFDIAEQLDHLQQAMRLRGFQPRGNRQSWQQLAAVTGTLLVRSYEQSERVYKAMRLRGYGHSRSRLSQVRGWGHPGDLAAVGLCATISLSLIGLQLWQTVP
ncbi:cobalt ECF transporter T component CbiQ [Leptolyngbya cf. ectocarpi LEGE 11479]|uniref:Cobalt ECF transporter T component CbiQ n=1 Tax=Leptolyngbya cf. ectocarpi LEGE 11479 TaxID=1828722 RepID=A0A928ZXB8_LEPEC|nr:cobalt ECF transporter T component CbiQ [Leptolyngbya ectocarpi]MBE9069229.1 cobalt ECF transporter T component CbiQ [Leptolyngbya cf. ectocarpi LEGE 11479]